MLRWSFVCCCYLLALTSLTTIVHADVDFVAPAAGNDIAVGGPINVQWKDSGIAPSIAELTQYTLALYVGGNEDGNMNLLATFVAGGNFASGDQASGTIQSGIAAPLTNGFFFKIISTTSTGGQVINYSSRFSITGLTGTTASQYQDAVAALGGSTAGPPSTGDIATSTILSSASTQGPSSTSKTSDSTVTVTASNTPNGAKAPPKSGISIGETVGIAVACAFVAFSLVALAIWSLYRRRALRKARQSPPPGMYMESKAELSGMELNNKDRSATALTELSSPGIAAVEADDGNNHVEMEGTAIPIELEGDSVYGEMMGSPVTPRSAV